MRRRRIDPEEDALLPALRHTHRLLLVDDDPDMRAFVERVARQLAPGVRVDAVAAAREARARIGAYRYDAVLADYYLDAAGAGLSLRSSCMVEQPTARFAVMSSMRARDFERLPGSECCSFLQKPFDVPRCRSFLTTMLHHGFEQEPAQTFLADV